LFIYNNVYYGIIEKFIYGLFHYLINLFKAADVVLVPSIRSRGLLIAETKLFPEPVVYYNGYYFPETGNGINSELYKYIEKLKSEKIIIAAVGRLDLDKRIDRAINILKLVKHKNTHLLVFGDGELENDLRKLVKNLNLAEHVDLLGYVAGFNNYYKLFDVVLFTSDWEGMPLTMWEAMANKVPVLAPDVGGFKEILEENNCGIIYKPGNVNDAAEKLISLLEDHLLRIKLGNNGMTAIREKYNEENFIKQIENVYSEGK
jgi:glycosyltransferase involved in cell wall biosynthesis